MKLDSLEEVLKFAIRKEADAAAYYRMVADRSNPGVRKTFEELAKEEERHRKKLEGFDLKKVGQTKMKKAKSLGMSEILEDVSYSPDMSYADLLRMAIKNEERAERVYRSTAALVTDPKLKKLLSLLAGEETTHKTRLEKIYDEEILTEF